MCVIVSECCVWFIFLESCVQECVVTKIVVLKTKLFQVTVIGREWKVTHAQISNSFRKKSIFLVCQYSNKNEIMFQQNVVR